MTEERTKQTRVRISYTIEAKGDFKPDITSEAEDVATAMSNLRDATDQLEAFRIEKGWIKV